MNKINKLKLCLGLGLIITTCLIIDGSKYWGVLSIATGLYYSALGLNIIKENNV